MKASDNEYPSLLFDEQGSNPATPPTGFWRAYFKSTGLFVIDDAGVVTGPFGTGGGGTPVLVGAQVYDSAGTALTASTFTTLPFDTETFDTDAFHTGSGSKLIIPSGKDGYYLIVGHVQYGASATADRIIGIRKNGATTTPPDLSYVRNPNAQNASNPTRMETSAIAHLVATDWVELIAYTGASGTSTAAGAINYFSAVLLGT